MAQVSSRTGDLTLQHICGPALDRPTAIALAELWCSANEHPGETLEDIWRWILRFWGTEHERWAPAVEIAALGARERYLAMAVGFARRVMVGAQPLTLMGLGGVCSAPDRRGEGLGAAVVGDQFGRVRRGEFPCALFGATPPSVGFYERLDAGLVSRAVVNSLGEDPQANPFGEDVVMGFPHDFAWPEGRIDLLGGGY
jgi:hypothetical protein